MKIITVKITRCLFFLITFVVTAVLTWFLAFPLGALEFPKNELYNQGVAFFEAGDYQQAIQRFEAYFEQFPNPSKGVFVRATTAIGVAQNRLGNYHAALEEFEAALLANTSLEPGLFPDLYSGLGIAHDNLGNASKARENYLEAVRIITEYGGEPQFIGVEEIYVKLGVAQAAGEDYEGALTSFQASTQIRPDYGNGHYFQGVAQINLGNYPGAESAFSFSVSPQVSFRFRESGYNGLGTSQFLDQDVQTALSSWSQSISEAESMGRPFPTALANRGIGYFEVANLGAAESDLAAAIRLDNQDPRPFNNLGYVTYEISQAAKYLSRVDDLKHALAELPLGASLYYEQRVRHVAHLPFAEESLPLPVWIASLPGHFLHIPPVDPDWREYARPVLAQLSQSKLQEAIRNYQQAIQLEPTYPNPYYGLGTAERAQQNYSEALTAFESAATRYRETRQNPLMEQAVTQLDIPAVTASLDPQAIEPVDRQVRAGFTFLNSQVTRLYDSKAWDQLTQLAASDPSSETRREAVHALRLATPQPYRPAYPVLQARLAQVGGGYVEPDRGVRSSILYFLEECQSPSPQTPPVAVPVTSREAPKHSATASEQRVRTTFEPPPLGPVASGCGNSSAVNAALCRIRI